MDDRIRRLMTLGHEHYLSREFEKAEQYLAEVVKEHRGFADVFNMLGIIYHDQGRFAQSQESFEEALRINPNYTEAALNLSVTYNDLGKYADARKVYMGAMARSRSEPAALDAFACGKIANMHADLGEVYASTGLYDEAIAEFQRALKLCPTFHDLRTRLAHIHRDAGNLETALEQLLQVKSEQPNYVPARVALGVTYYSLGKKDMALAEWRSASELDPDNKAASVFLHMMSDDSVS